jgi:acetyl-CoA decarbonylase/synthase complex subunit beta
VAIEKRINKGMGIRESKIKVPEGRVYDIGTPLDDLYRGLEDIGVGPRYFGHIRKGEWYCDLGGPKTGYQSVFWGGLVDEPGLVEDGRFELIGPDLPEMEPETTLPFALQVWMWGPQLTEDYVDYAERQGMMGILMLEGMTLMNTRDTTWIRIAKRIVPPLTFPKIAQAIRASALTACPLIEAVEIRLILFTPELQRERPELMNEMLEEAKAYWEAHDARMMELKDEDVDIFYGCSICKMIAPNHMCVITPSIVPYCGVVSYLSCKAMHDIDPTGYIFEVPRGEVLDPVNMEYSGVNEAVWDYSGNRVKRFYLNSCVKYPTTSCGCFEAAAFYIPEVDGIGLANRRYSGLTPLGIRFSTLAGHICGGAQNHGGKGVSVRSMKLPNFLAGDGGWDRIIWMPKDLKREIADGIPEEIYDKIATEDDAVEADDLKAFLQEKKHPIVEKFWKDGEPVPLKVPLPGEDWPEE